MVSQLSPSPSRGDVSSRLTARLEALVLPVIQGMGLKLWGMEHLPMGRKALLRIYVDGEDGVTVDQCAMVSRQVGPALEVEEALTGSYTLEVSSPGLERVFFHPEQLHAYMGRTVHVRLTEPADGRRSYQGTLKHAAGRQITLEEQGCDIILEWEQIRKMHLVHQF